MASTSAVTQLSMKLLEKKQSVAVEELNRKVRNKLKEMKVPIANKLKIRISEAMEQKLGNLLEENYSSIRERFVRGRKKAKDRQFLKVLRQREFVEERKEAKLRQRPKVRRQRCVKQKRGSYPVRVRAKKVTRVCGVKFDKQYCDPRRVE